MRWEGREGSRNIEDRRRRQVRRVGTGLGIGSLLLIGLALFMGQDPSEVLQQVQQQQQGQSVPTGPVNEAEEELAQFVSVVLKDCEDVWRELFPEQLGRRYEEPILVLFTGQTQSPCGYASAATGPFYCPGDSKLYIDLSFYDDLKRKFNAPGDFAMAYVISHEVGHHVQNLLGITREVQSQRRRLPKAEYNELSVRLELQADFLAGVWAHHAHQMKKILEEGDLQEALNAAHAIGDDRLQRQSQGYVVPESFTHGTSEQRMRWFTKGLRSGDLRDGDTFAAEYL
ncbi:MAG: zinc metallopeptidase [Saprospiraceae bacterium]|nr:zinc metallopeptidase [Saprospiraceae bacterium]